MTDEQIARVAHEANKAYCDAIGDHSQFTWDDAPDWQRNSALKGVAFHRLELAAGRAPSPSESHDAWRKEKQEDGWKYGPVKDVQNREHPCFVPYNKLPPEQRVKDYLFSAIVRVCLSN